MLIFAGLPILTLEMTLGQYASAGPIKTFTAISPVLKGLGYVRAKLTMALYSMCMNRLNFNFIFFVGYGFCWNFVLFFLHRGHQLGRLVPLGLLKSRPEMEPL